MWRVISMAVWLTACMFKPPAPEGTSTNRDGSVGGGDADGSSDDAPSCFPISEDFADVVAPPCGAWGTAMGMPARGGDTLEVVPLGDGSSECGCTTGAFEVGGAAALDLVSVDPGINGDQAFFELRLADGSATVRIANEPEGGERNMVSYCNGMRGSPVSYAGASHKTMRFAVSVSAGSVAITTALDDGAGGTPQVLDPCIWSNVTSSSAIIQFGAVAAVQPKPGPTYFDNLVVACP